MKVVRTSSQHHMYEYSVSTTLFSPSYSKVFTAGNNSGLVATDAQKNAVYAVAKRTRADTPEQFGVDLVRHFLAEYPVLSRARADVRMVVWDRAVVDGESHSHGWIKRGSESPSAGVEMEREGGEGGEGGEVSVTARVGGWTVFKSTQSGFAGYLTDKYTLLPPCTERCLSTELSAEWKYSWKYSPASAASAASAPGSGTPTFDFAGSRSAVMRELTRGVFGPAQVGVFSPSLQATIYDAACLVLSSVPSIASIKIDTPNKHYLPCLQLEEMGETFDNDIFVPTDEPSGTITCTVAREA